MPTGYTDDLYEDRPVSFKDFVLRCARSHLVCMRDASFDAPIPDKIEPLKYYAEVLEKAKQELASVLQWDGEKAEDAAKKDYDSQLVSRKEFIDKHTKAKANYEKMLEKVIAWTPPTEDHTSLKNFMIDQLNSSIRFDVVDEHYLDNVVLLSGEEFKKNKIDALKENVEYYETKNKGNVVRAEETTKWIMALKSSLLYEDNDGK